MVTGWLSDKNTPNLTIVVSATSPEGIPRFTTSPPRALRDRYQNVSQDVNFDILDVPKKITWAKFGFLSIFVKPRDKKWAFLGWGVGTLNSAQKPYMKINLHIRGISLKQTFSSFVWHIGWKNPFISLWAMTDNVKPHGRKPSKNLNVNLESFS